MPEAERIEVFESSNPRTEDLRRDCDVFLREIYSTKTRHLNCLHARGTVLFAEGEQTRGVYILRSGAASVSVSSSDGRVLIVRIARAGDLLGLNSILRSSHHDTTVRVLEPSCTDFIFRREFIDLLARSKPVNNAVLRIISKELADLTERAKSLLLSQTTSAKLAKLLLEWCEESEQVEVGLVRIDKKFTHEQIAQMIGSTRETVTRLFSGFLRSQTIRINSGGILIVDPIILESIAFGTTS